jgi:hypothetical protein
MPNKSKKKKSQRNRRQREVAEGLEAFEEQPPTSIGLTSTGVWIFSLRFVFLSLKHAAFSALQHSMPTRTRMLHLRSPAVHLLCL